MATNKHALIRYEALDRCFSNKGKRFYMEDLITYVSEAVSVYMGIETSISRRQIFTDMDFMKSETGFRAPIESLKDGKRVYYRYNDLSYSITMQQINPVEADLLKTAIDMLGRFRGLPAFDFLPELALKLKKSFQLEDLDGCIFFDHNEYLKNIHLLNELLKTIQNKQVLEITYRSFNQSAQEVFVMHPYFLKQYNKRWFLFGQREDYESWSNLALDRILAFEVKDAIDFVPNTVPVEDYFEDVIGVSKPLESTAMLVDILVNRSLWPYIHSKPLHPSQKVMEVTDEHVRIQLDVFANYELYALLLGFGDKIEVLGPEVIRAEMNKRIQSMMERYAVKL